MIFEKLPKANLDDKEHLFALVDLLVKMAEKARREGILALEEKLYDDDFLPSGCGEKENFLIRQLFRMLCDGIEGTLIAEFARNYVESVNAADEKDPSLLALMIGTTGILRIQEGVNPYVGGQCLAAMMGHPLCEEYIETHLSKD